MAVDEGAAPERGSARRKRCSERLRARIRIVLGEPTVECGGTKRDEGPTRGTEEAAWLKEGCQPNRHDHMHTQWK